MMAKLAEQKLEAVKTWFEKNKNAIYIHVSTKARDKLQEILGESKVSEEVKI